MSAGYCFPILAQPVEDEEIKIYRTASSRLWSCYRLENKVYDEQKFNELLKNKECSHFKELKIDFTKQTLIGFKVQGDCFVHGIARVFRLEQTKTYQVRVKNIWGGCRAAGAYSSWLVIDKIPDDYKVEFSETRVDDLKYGFDADDSERQNLEVLESHKIDLQGCIPTYLVKSFIIKDEATYLKAIRQDAERERCLKNVEKIDFEKNSLLGIAINSGYCHYPLGLKFEALKNDQKKEINLKISYIYPKGSLCRAVSRYGLWVLVPKIPDGFEVKFDVRSQFTN